jgi:hypothetical protein
LGDGWRFRASAPDEALEEPDDVQAVHANFDVDADVLERATA